MTRACVPLCTQTPSRRSSGVSAEASCRATSPLGGRSTRASAARRRSSRSCGSGGRGGSSSPRRARRTRSTRGRRRESSRAQTRARRRLLGGGEQERGRVRRRRAGWSTLRSGWSEAAERGHMACTCTPSPLRHVVYGRPTTLLKILLGRAAVFSRALGRMPRLGLALAPSLRPADLEHLECSH